MALQTVLKSSRISESQLQLPIEELGLSNYTQRALKAVGLQTLGQLLEKSEEEIRAIRRLGRKSFEELKRRLIALGYLTYAATTIDLRHGLAKEILNKIDAYLSDTLPGRTVSDWATKLLAKQTIESPLFEEALVTLACLHDEDDRLDAARDDLIFLRDCLTGNRSYWPALEFQNKGSED